MRRYPRRIEEQDWPGHGACNQPNDKERFLIANRDKFQIYGEIEDKEMSYEYDEYAVIGDGSQFWLLQTSGCSCPSPTETWKIDCGPCSLPEIEAFIRGGYYSGYTLPKRIEEEFIQAVCHSWW